LAGSRLEDSDELLSDLPTLDLSVSDFAASDLSRPLALSPLVEEPAMVDDLAPERLSLR